MTIRYTDSSISAAQSAANNGLTPLTPKRLPSDHTIVSGDEVWLKGGGPDYVMPATAIPCNWVSVLNGAVLGWPGTPKPVVRHPNVGDLGTQARVFRLGDGGNWTVQDIIFRNCGGACANMNAGGGTGILTVRGVEVYNCGTVFYPSASGYLTNIGAGGTSALAEVYMFDSVFDGAGSDQCFFRASNRIEVAHNTFRNPSLNDDQGDNLQIFESCTDLWVHHNFFDHRNRDSKQCFIQSLGFAGVTRFEHNEVQGWQGEVSAQHNAVYSDQRLICRSNYIKTTASAVYYGTAGTRVHGNVIEMGGGRLNTGGVWGATVVDVRVFNNTMLKTIPGTDVGDAAIRSTTSNATIVSRNNIIVGFRRGIRRGALSVEENNCIFGAENAVVNASAVGIAQTSPVSVDPTSLIWPDASLIVPDGATRATLSTANALALAGVYEEGVHLINGRMRPGWCPVGAYQAVLSRQARA